MTILIPYPPHNLIADLKTKKASAFSYLYESYGASLLGAIKKMISCAATSEDILQNVFIKIWSNVQSYSSEKGSLFTWMLRITKNETIDYLRSKEGKKASLTQGIDENFVDGGFFVESRFSRIDILRSFKSLSGPERAILHLYLCGHTCREISTLVSMPEGTVKTKMRNAYPKLRAALA